MNDSSTNPPIDQANDPLADAIRDLDRVVEIDSVELADRSFAQFKKASTKFHLWQKFTALAAGLAVITTLAFLANRRPQNTVHFVVKAPIPRALVSAVPPETSSLLTLQRIESLKQQIRELEAQNAETQRLRLDHQFQVIRENLSRIPTDTHSLSSAFRF